MVLHAEDNPVTYLLVEQMLRRWTDVHLLGAESVVDAIAVALWVRPQVTLPDVDLIDGEGMDLQRPPRGNARTADLRIMVLS